MIEEPTTGWYPDPSERFQERFLLRGVWSSLVRDGEDEEAIDHPSPSWPLPAELASLASTEPTAATGSQGHVAVAQAVATSSAHHNGSNGAIVAPGASLGAAVGTSLLPPPAPGTQTSQLLMPIPPAPTDALRATALLPLPSPLKSSGRWTKLGIGRSDRTQGSPGAEMGSNRGITGTLKSLRFVLVALVVGVGAVAAYRFTDRAPSWPKTWDPRVADLVTFVEDERNLDFEHPVNVQFMDVKEFDAAILARRTGGADTTEQDNNNFAVLRALGLVTGAPDAEQTTKDLSSVIVGYYDFAGEIKVRGPIVTPEIRLTLAHELTHALQDQHFELAKLQGKAPDDSAGYALLGLIEGDARRTELAYFETLDEGEQNTIIEAETDQIEASTVGDAPVALRLLQSAPYELGQIMVSAFAANSAGGTATIDHAFESPPKSDLALVDPVAYLLGDDAREVETPELADGDDELEVSTVGALGWYLTVASRFEPARALGFAHDWRGDTSVSFKRSDETVCLRTRLRGTDAAAVRRMEATLQDWANGVASGGIARPEVINEGDTMLLTTCDPGTSSPAPPNSLEEQYGVLVLRNHLAVQFMTNQPKAQLSAASCVGDAYVERFGAARLGTDVPLSAEEELVSHEVVAACAGAEIAGPPPTTILEPSASSSRANPSGVLGSHRWIASWLR
jgi:hypothetical protein